MTDPAQSPISVLVAGLGAVGQSLVDALTAPHFKRRVHCFLLVPRLLQLDQPAQQRVDEYRTQGVQLLEGEVSQASIEYLAELFLQHKIDTVVSCLGAQQVDLQHALIDAARHGGVNHFIPSDFGPDWDAMAEDDPLYETEGRARRVVHSAAKESGMDWTFIACGAFAEHLLTSDEFGVDLANRTIRVPQALDRRVTYTALHDVGQLTAMAICDSSTRGKQIRTGRCTTTQRIIAALNQHRPGERQWSVEQLSTEQLQALVNEQPKSAFPRMALSSARGTAATVWDEGQTWKNGEYGYTTLDAVAQQILPEKDKQEEKKE